MQGRYARLACQQHLDDLQRQNTAAFPYHFDASKVANLLAFYDTFVTLDDVDAEGQPKPFRLVRWLQFAQGMLVGWLDAKGHRRFVQAFTESGKGTTKTPAMAALGVYGLVGENRNAVQIYALGVNGDQANYTYQFAKRMCERSPDLRALLDIAEYNTAWLARHSFFRPLTSEGRSLDNKRIFMALIDELQEHPSSVIPDKMRLGVKGQPDALIIECCNAGYDKTSVAWRHHDYSVKVLEGVVDDPTWFSYICSLDPCEDCRGKGAIQPVDGCPKCDDWTNEAVWPKVNPALYDGVATYEYMRGVVRQALNQPSMLAIVKRLNFCQWTEQHTIWIPADQWAACKSEAPRPDSGVPCAAAFDMSMKHDLSACVVAQRFDDPVGAAPDDVEIADNDNGLAVRRIWKANYRVRLHAYAWLPEDTLVERVRNERIPYDVWRKSLHLSVTPGPVIDHHLIFDTFVNDIGARFKPQRVGYDPHNATELAVDLRDRGKYTIAEIGQGRRLSEFVKLFYALVRLGRIEHDGNPLLAWCIANAEPKSDRYENQWLEKSSPTKRIDLAIAAVMALSQVVALPTPQSDYVGVFVV